MRTEMESVSLKSCPPGAAPTGSAMERVPVWYSARELSDLGVERIPDLFQLSKHLIFSSPATLAFNSPGAEGFGVKRAGLAIPDSVMLIVSPGCCGRNTSGSTHSCLTLTFPPVPMSWNTTCGRGKFFQADFSPKFRIFTHRFILFFWHSCIM